MRQRSACADWRGVLPGRGEWRSVGRVTVALRNRGAGEDVGKVIPDGSGVDRPIEGEGTAIPNQLRGQMADVGPEDAAAYELAAFGGDDVDVDVRPGQEAHVTFDEHACVGHVDDRQVPASAKSDARERFVGGRRSA